MRRSTGGNRFIDHDSERTMLVAAFERGLKDLEEWAEQGGEKVDWGAVALDTKRVRSGISVEVTADMIPPEGISYE